MEKLPHNLSILVLLFIGLVVLEIYLAKRENKWPGRIIPIIFLIQSLIIPFEYAAGEGARSSDVINLILAMIVANIPTLIFIGIYLVAREKLKREEELEKMNLKDL